MTTSEIISAIDAEIANLQQARSLLSTLPASPVLKKRGRPAKTATVKPAASKTVKRAQP